MAATRETMPSTTPTTPKSPVQGIVRNEEALIALVAGAFAATAFAPGSGPVAAAADKAEANKVASAKAPKTISVKDQLKKQKSKKSSKQPVSSIKSSTGDKPAK